MNQDTTNPIANSFNDNQVNPNSESETENLKDQLAQAKLKIQELGYLTYIQSSQLESQHQREVIYLDFLHGQNNSLIYTNKQLIFAYNDLLKKSTNQNDFASYSVNIIEATNVKELEEMVVEFNKKNSNIYSNPKN